jgi:hypothetical protein
MLLRLLSHLHLLLYLLLYLLLPRQPQRCRA